MSEYRFTIDRSDLEGKQGILKVGDDGYVDDVLVGIFNVENAGGQRYVFDSDVAALLDTGLEKSYMTKWLAEGKLIGEQEHPHLSDFLSKDLSLAQSKAMWTARNGELLASNIAMQIGGLRCSEMANKIDGRKVFGVYVRMRPAVDALSSSLLDPNSNTAFSLRSMIKRVFLSSEIARKCTNIFTYDWVTLNGIRNCEKFSMPGLESAGVEVNNQLLSDINAIYEDESIAMGLECGSGIITQVIKENGNWREVPDLTPTLCLGRQLNGSNIYLGK